VSRWAPHDQSRQLSPPFVSLRPHARPIPQQFRPPEVLALHQPEVDTSRHVDHHAPQLALRGSQHNSAVRVPVHPASKMTIL
jgi:hypothetical protein